MLSTSGQQFTDWSASYRLFERERIDPQVFFETARKTTMSFLDPQAPIVAMIDDTLVHKTGRAVAGASWHRDPLGPPFQTNLIWSQRFVQCSLALPEFDDLRPGSARAIPIALRHAPTPRKPKRDAPEQQWVDYRQAKNIACLSRVGAQEIQALRARIDTDPAQAKRKLIVCADGSYTNRNVIKHLPAQTTLIGRIRKDCKLYALPEQPQQGRGRTRRYGQQLPTPEEMRQDLSLPWRKVRAWAAGRYFNFEIKSIGPVRWRPAGGERNLRLIIVRPLAYRRRKGARLLYRKPAYLICTDPNLDEAQLLQAYVWRWEIELNFREEKTLLGVGEAQVRTPAAVERVPSFQVAAYSFLLLAERMVRHPLERIPQPRWRRKEAKRTGRISTGELVRMLRAEIWGKALGVENFSGFVKQKRCATKPEKLENALSSAICYAS